jgi:undecaprenyl-diphosphatase
MQLPTYEMENFIMSELDFAILNFIQEHLRSSVGDFLMPLISALGNAGLVWIALTCLLCAIPRYRKAGITMALALLMDFIMCNIIIKPMVARIRPFDVNTNIILLIKAPADFSFPSGHTAAAFSATFSLAFGKNKIWIPSAILASLIAFSRLYLYVHYPSDVLAGFILGMLLGFMANVIYNLVASHLRDKNAQL